jgi:hypothetical protein
MQVMRGSWAGEEIVWDNRSSTLVAPVMCCFVIPLRNSLFCFFCSRNGCCSQLKVASACVLAVAAAYFKCSGSRDAQAAASVSGCSRWYMDTGSRLMPKPGIQNRMMLCRVYFHSHLKRITRHVQRAAGVAVHLPSGTVVNTRLS